MEKKEILIIFMIIFIYSIFGVDEKSAEELDIPAGVGMDIIETTSGQSVFQIPVSIYNFAGGEIGSEVTSSIREGKGSSIGKTREDRQRRSNKRLLIGVEKIYVLSEKYAASGIDSIIDIIFANSNINDMGNGVVCKGNSRDILQMQIPYYPSSSDYIDGIIKNSNYYNFFGENYKLIDMYIRSDSEGRNMVLPYIEKKADELEITGMALFEGTKMIQKIDMEEARLMSMLREDKTSGILSIVKGHKEYIDVSANVKRKVKSEKVNDKYYFTIDLNIVANIVNNELYNELIEKKEVTTELEKDLKEKLQKECDDFINNMKENYKVDCLQLGRVAAAKHGRRTGTDWNKVVLNSDIKVNIKIKIDNYGRGDY